MFSTDSQNSPAEPGKLKQNLVKGLKWFSIAGVVAALSIYVTVQTQKPVLSINPADIEGTKKRLSVHLLDNGYVLQCGITVYNAGPISATNTNVEWFVIDSATETEGEWNNSKDLRVTNYMGDIVPEGRYTINVTATIDMEEFASSPDSALAEFNSDRGYITLGIKATYKNGLFPFVRHRATKVLRYTSNQVYVLHNERSYF